MDRETIVKLWNEAWTSGLWAAAWSKSVEGLTAAQATWQPTPQRHSIWQIVEHMIFWRETGLARAAGGPQPSDDEIAKRNFPSPAGPTDAAWQTLVKRFRETQERVAAAIANPKIPLDRFPYLLAHDAYHIGQINYVRALQGLPPVE